MDTNFVNTAIYLRQVGLNALGFGPLKTDGIDGDKTRGAVSAFEKAVADARAVASGDQSELAFTRQINAAGIELVTHFEGLHLTAYKCPADVWTIGYGHTGLTHEDGTVYPGRKITKEEAVSFLQRDLGIFGRSVEELVSVSLTDDQFAALVSLAFNVGSGNLKKSTLLRKLNAGDYKGAADQFLVWNRADGQVLKGLTRRRKSERNLFLGIKPAIVPA